MEHQPRAPQRLDQMLVDKQLEPLADLDDRFGRVGSSRRGQKRGNHCREQTSGEASGVLDRVGVAQTQRMLSCDSHLRTPWQRLQRILIIDAGTRRTRKWRFSLNSFCGWLSERRWPCPARRRGSFPAATSATI